MGRRLDLAVCVVLLLLLASCVLASRPIDQLFLAREAAENRVGEGYEAKWMEQILDHFNPADTRSFKQRWFEDLSHFSFCAPNPIVLLNICGEAPCGGMSPNDWRMDLASQLHAVVVSLEHRYYGASQPFGDLSTESLKYLSANQALADLANFHAFYEKRLSARLNSTACKTSSSFASSWKPRWLVTGGSYAGALTAWARLKYPHLYHAALASSGVVQVIKDFTDFDKQIVISAGPACSSLLKTVTQEVERQLAASPESAAKLKAAMHAEQISNNNDFRFLVTDAAVFAFQYGRPDDLCTPLQQANTSTSSLLSAYSHYVGSVFFGKFGSSPDDYDRAALANTSVGVRSSMGRAWLYQCCTQMAFWQTPYPGSIRPPALNMSYWRDLCSAVFGGEPPLFPDTEATNNFYGGTDIASSRIVFSNGSQDPWQRASRLASTPMMPGVIISCNNCGHCVDLRGCPPPSSNLQIPPGDSAAACSNPEAVRSARSIIASHLIHWMTLPSSGAAERGSAVLAGIVPPTARAES